MQSKGKHIRIDKRKGRQKAAFGLRLVIQLALLAVVVATALIVAASSLDDIAQANMQLAVLEEQIAAEIARQQEIADSAAYIQSISFIENIARERLMLVRRDEIIFVMVEE